MDKKQTPDLVEISVSNRAALEKETVSLQATLKDVTRLFNNLVRAAESAKNEGTYFSTAMKQITTSGKEAGVFTQKILVEAKELENVISALKAKNQEMMTGKGWEFEISSKPAQLVQGTVRQVIGEDAFKLLQAEAQARGGEAVRSPTKKNPNRVSYWYQADQADEITGTHKTDIFREALRLSKQNAAEMAKKAEEAARAKQEREEKAARIAEEREQKRLDKIRSKQQVSTQTYNEKEEAKKADAARKFQEKVFFMFSNMQGKERYAQNRQEERVNLEKLKQQNRMEMFKAKQEAATAEKKERIRHKKITSIVKAIMTLVTVSVDLLRRLVVNSVERASKFVSENTQGYTLGMPMGNVRALNIFDASHGIPTGTSLGAIQDLQNKFGDITNLDEKALGVLARVMGSEIADLVKSGLGGDEPEVLLEKILDKYFEQFKQGKNSLGQTVGQNQALRELVTTLSSISPELGTLLAKMAEDYRSGAYGEFSNYPEWRGSTSTNTTGLSAIDIEKFHQLGSAIDKLTGKLKDITDGVLVRFGNSLFKIVDWISNIRVFMSPEEKIELDMKNARRNKEEASRISSLISSRSKAIKGSATWKALGIKTSPEDLYEKNRSKFNDIVAQDPELGADLAWLATLSEYKEQLEKDKNKKYGSGIDLAVQPDVILAEEASSKTQAALNSRSGGRTGRGYADDAVTKALLDISEDTPDFALSVLKYLSGEKGHFSTETVNFAYGFGKVDAGIREKLRRELAKGLSNEAAAELIGDILGPNWGSRNSGDPNYDKSIDAYLAGAKKAFADSNALQNLMQDVLLENMRNLGVPVNSTVTARSTNEGGAARVIIEIKDPQGHSRETTLELGSNLLGNVPEQSFIYDGTSLLNAGGQ